MLKKVLLTVAFLTAVIIFITSERSFDRFARRSVESRRTVAPLLPVEPAEPLIPQFELATVVGGKTISAYDDVMRRVAAETGQDWRLLSAIAYHESRFDPQAVSKQGALGLMQIMPHVAQSYDVPKERAIEPEVNVMLASKLLVKLNRALRFSSAASDDDRLCILLASYVGGIGHVNDARRLAAKNGENPDSWEVVSHYLDLKSQPEFYTDSLVRCGRFTGIKQTLAYVRNVKSHYRHYCDLAPVN